MSRLKLLESRKLIALIFLFMITAAIVGGFLIAGSKAEKPIKLGDYQIDPIFQEIYTRLGGKDVLGIPISPRFSHGGIHYQYTAAVLLMHNPSWEPGQQVQLAPLGKELDIGEIDITSQHQVYAYFTEIYGRFGFTTVGHPLTNARYNVEKDRVEQYFENMGFYHQGYDPIGEVELLHYGAWKCAEACGYASPTESNVLPIASVELAFIEAIELIDQDFKGDPLTDPEIAYDGQLEQIFENMVVIAAPNDPSSVHLRPVPSMLRIPGEPSAKFPIPEYFWNYIIEKANLEFVGDPIQENAPLSKYVYRQCYTNLCLDYFSYKVKEDSVHPTPLGYAYRNLYYQNGITREIQDATQEIRMRVSERFPSLSSHQLQEISVAIVRGNTPMEGLQPSLLLTIPSGESLIFSFPPTGPDGTTRLEIGPLSAVSGTRVEYLVCVNEISQPRFCVLDDFLIWDNP